MLNVDIDVLQECWTEQQKFLKEGLIGGDFWDCSTGLSISGVNSMPEAVAMFNRLTEELKDTLSGSGFPELNRYFIINLEEDKLFVIICHSEELMQGMLLNPKKVNMGILFTVAVPKALDRVKKAFL